MKCKQFVNTSVVEPQADLLKTLVDQLTLARLPLPEPSMFNGDPLAFPGWKESFQALIGTRTIPPEERLHYLKRYVGGDAKSCIEGYLLMATFEDAWKLLENRFIDPFVIANSFKDKLEAWTRIGPNDVVGLRRFVDLHQCETAMRTLPSRKSLDDPREQRKAIRLACQAQGRVWCKRKFDDGSLPLFTDLVKFLHKESEIVNDPVMSLRSLKTEGGVKAMRNIDTTTKIDKKSTSLTTYLEKATAVGPCSRFCKSKDHYLSGFKSFVEQSRSDKETFAKKFGICFGCLRKDHISYFIFIFQGKRVTFVKESIQLLFTRKSHGLMQI